MSLWTLCLLSVRIWEHLSSHRRRPDLLYNLRSARDPLVWILVGGCWGPAGDHFWERHRKSWEDDCGKCHLLFLCISMSLWATLMWKWCRKWIRSYKIIQPCCFKELYYQRVKTGAFFLNDSWLSKCQSFFFLSLHFTEWRKCMPL